jgi:hypothetical protein
MRNEFSCLSNALLVAGLRCGLPVAFAVPSRVRKMVKGVEAAKVKTVTLHQCPKEEGLHYVLEVHTVDGDHKMEEFDGRRPTVLWDPHRLEMGMNHTHDTYVLYDRGRDGPVTYLHCVN